MKYNKHTITIFSFIISWIVLPILFFSCEEEIQLELNNPENQRIVVEGRITSELKNQQVRITKTISYFQNEQAPPVLDAMAYMLEEGTGHRYYLTLIDDSLGMYQTDRLAGHFGETYSLIINQNDQTYKATSYLDTVPVIDSLNFEYQYLNYFGYGFGVYIVKMSAYEPPPEGQFYRIDIYINDTLYTDQITEPVYTSDFQINDRYLPDIEVFSIPQERIRLDSNIIRLQMSSISEEEINFVYAFISESYGSGSIFSGPPANIPTNIKNTTGGLDGVGFFGASGVSSIEATLYKVHADSTNNPFYEDNR